MITTKGVYHMGIPVNDVERAVKFYTEILGMTIAKLNRDDSNKVLLLDYNKILADVIGPNARDNWLKHSAPRHDGTLNVLFMEGHTETRDPAEIDPRIRAYHEKFWRPFADDKLAWPL